MSRPNDCYVRSDGVALSRGFLPRRRLGGVNWNEEIHLLRLLFAVVASVAIAVRRSLVFAQHGGHGGGGGFHSGGRRVSRRRRVLRWRWPLCLRWRRTLHGGYHGGGYGWHGGYNGWRGGYWGYPVYGYGWGLGIGFSWGPYWPTYPYAYGYGSWWGAPYILSLCLSLLSSFWLPYPYSLQRQQQRFPASFWIELLRQLPDETLEPSRTGEFPNTNSMVINVAASSRPLPNYIPMQLRARRHYRLAFTMQELPPVRREVQNVILALRAMPPDARQRQIDSGRYSNFSPEEINLLLPAPPSNNLVRATRGTLMSAPKGGGSRLPRTTTALGNKADGRCQWPTKSTQVQM